LQNLSIIPVYTIASSLVEHRVKVKLPANYSIDDACYFENRDYDIPHLKIRKLRNTIITYDGICLFDYNLLKESVHGYRDKIIISKLSSKLDLLNYDTFLLHDSNKYLLIHGPIISFYHWLTESIPRILLVKAQIKNLVLLLPISLKNDEFVRHSLMPFTFKDVFYIPRNWNIKIKQLVLPQIKPFFASYDPQTVNVVRKLYIRHSKNESTYQGEYYDRIFLCNKEDVSNIDDFISQLHQLDFHYVNIRHYSFYDLVQIISHVKIVISSNCNDLVCINFLKKGASVLELIRKSTPDMNRTDLRYLNLASCLGLKYYYQLCQASGSGLKSQSKLKVDLKTLRQNFNLIINS
jgi:hypothetical protein